jgi:hypothetical protein
MTKWQGQPAIGVVLGKLVELHGRIGRLDLEKKRQRAERVLALVEKATR